MKLGTSFLTTRIARRFFLLFLVCAFIPTSILAYLSYSRVMNQMEEQSYVRLQKETKAYGMGLFDRLVHMHHLLQLYSILLQTADLKDPVSSVFRGRIHSFFNGVAYFSPKVGFTKLVGEVDREEVLPYLDQLRESLEKTNLFVLRDQDKVSTAYMVFSYLKDNDPEYLVAELRSELLWGVGVHSMLPALTDLTVYNGGLQIFSTAASPGEELATAFNGTGNSGMRRFHYSHQGEDYLATMWPLFTKSYFSGPTWTIVLSQAKSDILSSVLEFRRMFPLVMLLVLWVILFLSIYFIRKTLNPMDKLQQGTLAIAAGDLDTRVAITSGDEFEDLGRSFNTMTSHLKKQFNAMAVIDKIDRAILSSLDGQVIVSRALRMMYDFFECSFIVYLCHPPKQTSQLQCHSIVDQAQTEPVLQHVNVEEGQRSRLFNTDKALVYNDKSGLPTFLQTYAKGGRRILSLPLHSENELFGALCLDLPIEEPQAFEEEVNRARQIADQVSIALSNASLVQNLERLSIGTVEALARTVDAKSRWTAGHSERVADLAVRIARAMAFTSDDVDLIYRGGLLHDIGKIGIPLAILDKPDRLDDEEYEQVKTHPAIGGKILEPIHVYKDIIPIIEQHHERYDGKGYPAGLAGDKIDPKAKVLAVADVYDALISQRPYRQGWVEEKVMNFMEEHSGTMFDPKVIDTFFSLKHHIQ